ncbi:M36 family metallopeptidase [Neolewinella antarctica]|uniref:Repeat protein (TIGR01451 family) n=1 Tax=Neolewinella antarctica TaxID=442734 RepID=A0ABX0XF39_9BACT|nr:M36 family metallopeptidase [Neolewinella antarctica]NJC27393.1 putative repeat protein (TIGR01451 family) [Neolewinella antarctica]
MKLYFTALLLLFVGVGLSAQSAGVARAYLQKRPHELGLTYADVRDLRVTDAYASPDGTEHIYLEQYHAGIPVFNAQAIVHLRDKRVVSESIDLVANLASFGLPTAPAFSAHKAVHAAAASVAPSFGQPIFTEEVAGEQRFVWPAVSSVPLGAKLVYLPGPDGVRLTWRILIDQHQTDANYYLVLIDAATGELIKTSNLVLHCAFGSQHQHDLAADCRTATPLALRPTEELVDGASYRVIPFGEESPLHGDRTLEVNPADLTASPFGWHDTNGRAGAEFTITRGNNVYAYPDRDPPGEDGRNDGIPDGETAEGGAGLVFDFPFAAGLRADSILPAAMVQSFYTVNKMHDWLFLAGFDEAAGNFQENNYGGRGADGDPVRAEVQDASGINNANFFTPDDGDRPRMQMQLFNPRDSNVLVLAPRSIAGFYPTGSASFGPSVARNGPYEGDVARADDGTADGNFACDSLINGEFLEGKIALVTRGTCLFTTKVENAQAAGAIAVIVCNNANRIQTLGGTSDVEITIPAVSMQQSDCELIIAALDDGDRVRIKLEDIGVSAIDSDFDAGIIAHEFGHGVSNRLVGGPSNTRCLNNDEQMGEGWSDFFTLASTPRTNQDNPDGSEVRGIGNYVISGETTDGGIRSQPYSTDRAINDKSYDDIIFTGQRGAPHPLGEVWAATLWDVYWLYVNQFGFDEDLINGTGGNNRAVQLVVEGMKYTKCNPTMLDARDGILEANRLVFASESQCELYQVFADRGLGFSADGGTADDRTDNRGGNDLTPYCTEEITLSKSVDSDFIDAGEEVRYFLKAFSYRQTTTQNVVITDTIPEGMTLLERSVSGVDDFTVEGNLIRFRVGDLAFEEEVSIQYNVESDETIASTTYFFDGAEDDGGNWEVTTLAGDRQWMLTDTTPFSGDQSWYIINTDETNDQALQLAEPITIRGDQPGLRFFTKYRTQAGWDAGIVETSTDRTNWTRVGDDKFLRGAYRGEVSPVATQTLTGGGSFWGDSEGFREIVIDVSEFSGQEVYFRFRFISDSRARGRGWWIDDIEVLDVVNYESAAVLTSDDGDNVRALTGNLGVIANGGNDVVSSTPDPLPGETTVNVFPNPAAAVTNVRITAQRAGSATVRLLTIDGRSLALKQLRLVPGVNATTFATDQLPAGVYVVQVTGADRVNTIKLTVR